MQIQSKRFWNKCISIMFMQYFKRFFGQQYENDWIIWTCLWFVINFDSIDVDDISDSFNGKE